MTLMNPKKRYKIENKEVKETDEHMANYSWSSNQILYN